MKPKDLKSPYQGLKQWPVVLQEGILFVPPDHMAAAADPFAFPGWRSASLFGNDNPIHVEYCSGNGAWIIDKARQHPQINWIAVEMDFDRARKIWSKRQNTKLANLFVVCGEAKKTTALFLGDETVTAAYVNYPDPWPKRRHAKYRIINAAFLGEVYRVLQRGGVMMVVTDDPAYSRWTVAMFCDHSPFRPTLPAPYYVHQWEGYGTSYFEELWRAKGRDTFYHSFAKGDAS